MAWWYLALSGRQPCACRASDAAEASSKGFERNRVEPLAHGAWANLPVLRLTAPEAGDRFAGGGVHQHRVLDLRWHPHAASGAVLLEVAFVQTPQFNVPLPCQVAQFFNSRDLYGVGLGHLRSGLPESETHLPEDPLALTRTPKATP